MESKWPNDIMADHKKLSGIVIEIQAESHGFCHVIIGIGININMQQVTKKEIDLALEVLNSSIAESIK